VSARVLVTGTGAICAAGKSPGEIWDAVCKGRSAIRRIEQWDTTGWPTTLAGEITGMTPRDLVEDRKLHKLLQRSDLLGLYAAGRALDESGFIAYRDALEPPAAAAVNDRTGVYAGVSASGYQNEYEFFPLLAAAGGDLGVFGRELAATVSPMWLLRSMPNNVVCHLGIRYGLKGPNACVTNHSVSGSLAVTEAAAALRAGEADRALAVGHDAPIEPQMVLYYQQLGLLSVDEVRPFDARRSGSLLGEGAAALVLETERAAADRHAAIFGEFLGSGCAGDAEGLLPIRADGDGLADAITMALDDAEMRPAEVGMIVAHGSATRLSDATEALAIRRVFAASIPPVTAFKWAFGHPLAASGVLDSVLALNALRHRVVPGVATLRELDPEIGSLPVSARPQAPRSDVALVLNRGFGGANTAMIFSILGDGT
jgi:3-oxoacyl-[acyl-carrier-protein] synthase I